MDVMKALLACPALLLAAACASTPERQADCDCPEQTVERAPPETAQGARAYDLAQALEAASYDAPERLAEMEDRIAALEEALGVQSSDPDSGAPSENAEGADETPPDAPDPEPNPDPAGGRPQDDPGLPPEPDLAGSTGLLHGVHVASYRDAEQARDGWAVLSERHAALSGLTPRIDETDLGEQGVYLRLKAGPFESAEAAEAACGGLEDSGDWCQVAAYDGAPLRDIAGD